MSSESVSIKRCIFVNQSFEGSPLQYFCSLFQHRSQTSAYRSLLFGRLEIVLSSRNSSKRCKENYESANSDYFFLSQGKSDEIPELIYISLTVSL